jgi:predicted DNA-binding protein (MmcQ/YjbR family)
LSIPQIDVGEIVTKRPEKLRHEKKTSTLGQRTVALMACIEAKPGAVASPMGAPRASTPSVLIYKVMGKMFAILSIRGIENVILKCDPNLAQALREQYTGVGHRSHLDRRYWISVSLDTDVPAKEIERLVGHSYELVSASLTRKQKAELAVLRS